MGKFYTDQNLGGFSPSTNLQYFVPVCKEAMHTFFGGSLAHTRYNVHIHVYVGIGGVSPFSPRMTVSLGGRRLMLPNKLEGSTPVSFFF